jgi:rhamnogalacturonyl hydrolase YesR
LHASKPEYAIPYIVPSQNDIVKTLDKVYNYINANTTAAFINKKTKEVVNPAQVDTNTVFQKGDFRITSYEWGVTYAGMLNASEATGDAKYANYTKEKLQALASSYATFKKLYETYHLNSNPLRSVVNPEALDDAGAMCAASIKLIRTEANADVRTMVDNYMNFIFNKQFRFKDGTLARMRPLPNTLWLDDLFMSVPALAQMGKLTGNQKYFDDACKQVLQFSQRMFNKEKKLYMHGWVEGMEPHPQFHWARANGWAVMAMAELLDVLPTTHPSYKAVMQQYKLHVEGLAKYQSGQGFWHQLLDREDSYLETSATAIYAYAVAKGINRKWLDAKAYGPMCLLAWNAVTTKVNDKGQVEGTCVGTGMAFEPAFYYYRPINVYAAHGYGPVLLAGSEIIKMIKQFKFGMNDSALQFVN